MKTSIDILKAYLSAPLSGERITLNETLGWFSLKSYKTNKNDRILKFLQELKRHAHPEFIIDQNGSAVYFFRHNQTMIEIDIAVGEEIEVNAYLWYEEEDIKYDFFKIIELESIIYSTLKEYNLQN